MHKLCAYCSDPLPEGSGPNRKFCAPKHRVAYYRNIAKKKEEYAQTMSEVATMPEHVQEMILLAFGAENADVFRQVLREEIRENVTKAVTDNVLGAGEILTQMLPKVLAGLDKDIQSEDWVVRSRAQALILKYAMSFAEKEGKEKDLGSITVVTGVTMPDTNLGRATAEQIIIEGESVEAFEADWPTCQTCNKRRHPDGMSSDGRRCKTCEAYRDIARRKAVLDEGGGTAIAGLVD